MEIDLIYCGGGNRRLAQIAVDAGFKYGAQLPDTVYCGVSPLYFADQDWKAPDRDKYMASLKRHRPHMATVLDWERPGQLPTVLDWAEEAAQYVDVVLIIPKVIGGVPKLPRTVGGKEVRLGYSVPTRYGGTSVPVWEFSGWPVHLLGGSPHIQMRLAPYFDARSVDGNYHMLKATKWCEYWEFPGRWVPESGIHETDVPYIVFEQSCNNIMEAWQCMF